MDLYDNGYNPMRWDCNKGGPGRNCFNKFKRPKIEVFANCFPRRINFGDVDGLVELNGKGLLLEWKQGSGKIPKGQRIAYEKLTNTGILTALCIVGDPLTMECTKYGLFFEGKWNGYKNACLDEVREVIKRWVKYTIK